jgi:catechol 2,3-dioxygenase-like lactoylglutathione lyase family enzyme
MAQSLTSVNVITLFVEDLQRSKEFYERVFEVAGADEGHGTVIVKFGNLFLRLLTRDAAESEMLGQVPLADPVRGQALSCRSLWTTQTLSAPRSPSVESRSSSVRRSSMGRAQPSRLLEPMFLDPRR